MKIRYYLITLLLVVLPLDLTFSQENVSKLSEISSDDGFSIKNNSNNTLLKVTPQGNVGIGTTNPIKKLQVNGDIGWGTTNAVLRTDQGASMELRGWGKPYIDFSNNEFSDYDVRLILTNNILEIVGNVGIGTDDTHGYKVAIDGNVVAEEIVVKLKNNWPDYVFNDSYLKPDLGKLEKYIKKNRHLPNIPTTEDVCNNGINIGEMQTKLLEKIEELTLYIIEQDKKIEKLEKDYGLLKKKANRN